LKVLFFNNLYLIFIEQTFIHLYMSRLEDKRQESKNLLVNTALRLFAEKGYGATSIRNIATEADVSLGLLYNYFGSKEELLLEIFRRGNSDISDSFANATKKKDGLKQHILQTVQILKKKRDFWRLLHSLRLQRKVVAQVIDEMKAQAAFVEDQIRRNLEKAGVSSPALEAKLLFAAIDGMASHYLLFEDYPIDEIAALLIQKYKSH
jgi:AcrR family transcriptional regulator